MPSVMLISLGCEKNLINSEQMLHLLVDEGFNLVGDAIDADAVVINTCGFIDSAKEEAIDNILAVADRNPDAKIVVAGCLAQRYGDELTEAMPEISALVGVGSFDDIVDAVKAALKGEKPCLMGDIHAPLSETGRLVTTPRHYSYLKISDGCSNRCGFCVIPSLRGKYRSRTMENIINEAKLLAESGTKELILIAQDITRYGIDLYKKPCLPELLRRLAEIDGIEWIRLHSLYPDMITDELIELIATEDKIVKYLDIPIQHVNDNILRAMNRRGTKAELCTLIEKLRAAIPGLVIRTSLICGLPGEGEEEFEELCEFLHKYRLERVGAFVFSPQEGTAAAEMEYPDRGIESTSDA